ncbi:hypothetical protein QBC40DRAFT_101855, partial [Triangularia verruculosa]
QNTTVGRAFLAVSTTPNQFLTNPHIPYTNSLSQSHLFPSHFHCHQQKPAIYHHLGSAYQNSTMDIPSLLNHPPSQHSTPQAQRFYLLQTTPLTRDQKVIIHTLRKYCNWTDEQIAESVRSTPILVHEALKEELPPEPPKPKKKRNNARRGEGSVLGPARRRGPWMTFHVDEDLTDVFASGRGYRSRKRADQALLSPPGSTSLARS